MTFECLWPRVPCPGGQLLVCLGPWSNDFHNYYHFSYFWISSAHLASSMLVSSLSLSHSSVSGSNLTMCVISIKVYAKLPSTLKLKVNNWEENNKSSYETNYIRNIYGELMRFGREIWEYKNIFWLDRSSLQASNISSSVFKRYLIIFLNWILSLLNPLLINSNTINLEIN